MKAIFFYSEFPTNLPGGFMDYLEVAKLTIPVNRRYWDYSIVYSTLGTKINRDVGFNRNIPIAHPEKELTHYIRVLSWLFYLESKNFDQDTVFLDSDVIINKDFKHVFENDFALAFSAYQTHFERSPINAGVFFAKHARKEEAINHLRKIVKGATLDRFSKDMRFKPPTTAGVWGVDEICLTKYLNTIAKADLAIKLDEFAAGLGSNEFRPMTQGISLFGYNYNMATKNHDPSLWPSATILHFRGISDSKPEMIKQYLAEHSS